jgi:hypothetical protein
MKTSQRGQTRAKMRTREVEGEGQGKEKEEEERGSPRVRRRKEKEEGKSEGKLGGGWSGQDCNGFVDPSPTCTVAQTIKGNSNLYYCTRQRREPWIFQ